MLQHFEKEDSRWVWIDLELGLPALFALNPLAAFSYYLPMCVKHRGWLFDDVDCDWLCHYLESIKEELGDERFRLIDNEWQKLQASQLK